MTDLVFAELRGTSKDSISMSIILREWSSKIHPEWEFRGTSSLLTSFVFLSPLPSLLSFLTLYVSLTNTFVVFIFNNRLTAATQYTDIVYVPEMSEKREEIKRFIQKYWEEVKEKIKCESYTMDLAIDPSLEHAIIVELNGPVFFPTLSPLPPLSPLSPLPSPFYLSPIFYLLSFPAPYGGMQLVQLEGPEGPRPNRIRRSLRITNR